MKYSIPAGGSAAGFMVSGRRAADGREGLRRLAGFPVAARSREPAGSCSALQLSLTLLLFTLALLLLGGCAGRDIAGQPPAPAPSVPPDLQHSGTQQQFHSFESAELTFHFTVTNPGPGTLQLHSYRYRLEVVGTDSGSELGTDPDATLDPDRSPLASGRQELAGRRVPAGGSTSLEVPMQLPPGEPAELPYRLVMEVSAESEAGENIQLTSEVNGTLPRPRLPQVRIPEVVITQFKTHTIDIEYRVEISNPNAFPLVLSQTEYTFSVRGTVWDEGSLAQGLQIPAESSTSVSKPMVFNYLKAGRRTVDTLISGKSIDYRITGAAAATPGEQPSAAKSSESSTAADPEEPVPYRFSFELEETAALIRP